MESDSMVYRSLGGSGVKVSFMGFGNLLSYVDGAGEQKFFELTDKCIRSGINYFDTAEAYGKGAAEIILGKNLKQGEWDRDDLVISTKFGPHYNPSMGNSMKSLRKRVNDCLERLQLDNADVLFLHRPDHAVPLLEQVRTMNQFIEDEKAYYWGTSEFPAQTIMEIHQICDKYGFVPPIVEQCEYSMIRRQYVEVDYAPLFDHYGLGTTTWSPLAMGILSGKYNDGNIPPDSRFAQKENAPLLKRLYDGYIGKLADKGAAMLQGLGKIAEEVGCTQSQLALAWVLLNKDVSTCLFGASSLAQIEDNLVAVDVMKSLGSDVLEKIEGVLNNRPTPSMNWRIFTPNPPRR